MMNNLEHVPINMCYTPPSYIINHGEEEIRRRADDLDPLALPIPKVARDGERFAILEGNLNVPAMKMRGIQMLWIQIVECDPIDWPYLSIKFNKHKKFTHRMIALMIPVITEWWNRHNPGNDKARLRKFVADTLKDLGTQYSERNIQKLFDIIQHAPTLLDSMDNTDRIIDRFHKLALLQAGITPPPAPTTPADPLHNADDDNDDDSATCRSERGSGAVTGKIVEIRIGDTVQRLDSGQFCRACVVNRLVFEAVNTIVPVDQGIDPVKEGGDEQ